MPKPYSKDCCKTVRGTESDLLFDLPRCCDCLSNTKEGHLCHLHILFECFREHNLKVMSMKCEFFKNEINYLAHHVSKEGVWPSKKNLKAVARFAPPQTYTKIQAFLDLVGHYWWFIKGFACIAQPLHKHLSGEGSSKKNEHVTLMEGMLWDAEESFSWGFCVGFPWF